jgi:hypothetical protein
MFIRRIVVVVVVVVVVEDFLMTIRVRSRLTYPEDAPFPICF